MTRWCVRRGIRRAGTVCGSRRCKSDMNRLQPAATTAESAHQAIRTRPTISSGCIPRGLQLLCQVPQVRCNSTRSRTRCTPQQWPTAWSPTIASGSAGPRSGLARVLAGGNPSSRAPTGAAARSETPPPESRAVRPIRVCGRARPRGLVRQRQTSPAGSAEFEATRGLQNIDAF